MPRSDIDRLPPGPVEPREVRTHHVGHVDVIPHGFAVPVEDGRFAVEHQTGEDGPDTTEQLGLLEQQITRADLASRIEAVSSNIADKRVANDASE